MRISILLLVQLFVCSIAIGQEIFQRSYSIFAESINLSHDYFRYTEFSKDDSRMLVPSGNGTYLINSLNGGKLKQFPVAYSPKFSSDGSLIINVEWYDKSVSLYNSNDGSQIYSILFDSNMDPHAELSQDNTRLLVISGYDVILFDVVMKKRLMSVPVDTSGLKEIITNLVQFSSDGKKFFILSRSTTSTDSYLVKVFDTLTGLIITEIPFSFPEDVSKNKIQINFLKNTDKIIIRLSNVTNIWDLTNKGKNCSLSGEMRFLEQSQTLTYIDYSIDGRRKLSVYDANNCSFKSEIFDFEDIGYKEPRNSLLNGKYLTSQKFDFFRVYDFQTGRKTLEIPSKWISASSAASVSPDNKLLVVTLRGVPNKVSLYDLDSGVAIQDLTSLTVNPADFTFSHDGNIIISEASNDERIILKREK